jgi:histidinol-phosphate/aromatic aminotransferase/cobyric acid decarboxylase-like protein
VAPEPRPELAALVPAAHGGAQDPNVLDFSTGISPLAPPAELAAAVRSADLSRYPHPNALPVREAAGALHRVAADRVVVGSGSVELIWAVARAFGGPGRTGLIVKPAFGEYRQALLASGAAVVEVDQVAPSFEFPVARIEAMLGSAPVALAFICRPSNPCLTFAPAEVVTGLARRWPDTLFIVDEAYLPMFEGIDGVPSAPNVVALRSMTKVFALPGLRLGYLVAPARVAAAIQASLPPWNVSSPAQAAGVVAARLLPLQAAPIRDRIAALRAWLSDALSPVAGRPIQAGGPFLLYESDEAETVVRSLRDVGVAVRHGASFGLPQHIRIGVREDVDNRTLVARWRAFARPGS